MRKNLLLQKIAALILFAVLLVACGAPPPEQTATAVEESPTMTEPATEPEKLSTESEVDMITDEAAVGPQATVDISKYAEYEIITLLPKDAIPAIDDPTFLTAVEADEEYEPEELIMGVFINDEARAYSVSHLSTHEIVNDTVGGRKISVTW